LIETRGDLASNQSLLSDLIGSFHVPQLAHQCTDIAPPRLVEREIVALRHDELGTLEDDEARCDRLVQRTVVLGDIHVFSGVVQDAT
jgi:hypothetical protein